MKSEQMVELLKEKLKRYPFQYTFDRKKDTLRIEDPELDNGLTVSLPGLIAKWNEEKESAVDEFVYYITESFSAMKKNGRLSGKEKNIYPVIRSASFPTESNGVPLLYDDHTAETRIYYALDLGKTYRLIDEKMMEKENWTHSRIREIACFNLRSLPIKAKEDKVAGNVFYFFNTNDGYDASRILNDSLLREYEQKVQGDMTISVPHQDVLIIGDIRNETGYDVLAQLTMSFFTNGRVPITALSFLYENKKLEPIFILAKNRKKGDSS